MEIKNSSLINVARLKIMADTKKFSVEMQIEAEAEETGKRHVNGREE